MEFLSVDCFMWWGATLVWGVVVCVASSEVKEKERFAAQSL
jgi:hypothetical protein